jgi:hypothetical protein
MHLGVVFLRKIWVKREEKIKKRMKWMIFIFFVKKTSLFIHIILKKKNGN